MFFRSFVLPFLLLATPLQSHPDTFRAHAEAAEARHRAGDLAGAETEYVAILGEAYHRLGVVSTAQGSHAAALESLQQAAAIGPESTALLVDLAIAFFHVEQYRKATEPLARALAREPGSAAAHQMMGKSLFMLGEFAPATRELEEAHRLAPKDYDVEYTLGLSYLKQKETAKARAVFDRMVAQLGDRAALRVLIARAFRETGFLAEGIDEFKKAIALDAHFPRVHYYLGLTYLLKDGSARIPDAAAEFRIELASHPDDYFANYYLGVLAVMERKWDDAVPLLEKASSVEPKNPDAYFQLGQAYEGLGRHDEAIGALTKSIEFNPGLAHNDYQVATAHFRLGQALVRAGRAEEGEKELQIAADLKSRGLQGDEKANAAYMTSENVEEQRAKLAAGSVADQGVVADDAAPPAVAEELSSQAAYYRKVLGAAYNSVGLLRAERGDFGGAAGQFALAAKWNPDQQGLNFNLGLARYKANDFRGAAVPLEAEVASHPDNVAARRLLGLSYFAADDFAKASAALAEVADASADLAILYPLALSLAKQGKAAEANRAIARMIEVGGNSAQLHVYLGQAYAAEGDSAKALAELEQALALDGKVLLAHFGEGMLYLKLGDFAKAAREFEAEMAINPSDTKAKFHLGFSLMAARDVERGLKILREVARDDPNYADARYELGKVLLQRGDVPGAITNLEAAAKLDPAKAHIQYQLGRAYMTAGRNAEGETHLEMSKRLKEEARDHERQPDIP